MISDHSTVHLEIVSDPVDDSPYIDRQSQHDREYVQAWENAPQEFKEKAGLLGMIAEPERKDGMAIEYDETKSRVNNPTHAPSFTIPDMAATLDSHVDRVVEKFGTEKADLVRAIASELRKPMEEEITRNHALLLGRVSCYLVADEKGNILARIHALLHSIPRLAAISGFPSMRASAKHCGVSPEWLRRTRDLWCERLGLQIPADGRKSDEAKEKYRHNAINNHWRNQKFKAAPVAA